MRGMKRILAMLLAVVMVVGLIPATVFAAETVLDAAIFCSDVHGSTSDLTSVLGGVKTSGVDYSSIGFVGDTCLTVANTTSTVQSALGDTDINVMFSYAASHDTENSADISTNWNYSGEVEGVSKYYLVYTIRETDMQNDTTAEDDFTTWYNGLTAAEKALPIFIMSHRPLHHRRKDNANATDWYNAISAAAKSSDIVVFWAHNHTSESDVDTAAYYVAKNGTETITLGTTSNSGGDTVTPNFTYMNAGYINANNQNPGRINVATTVQITADSLIFQDYTTSGEYSGTYAHNVTVAREFAASEPAATLTGITVTGTTEYTVGGNGLALTVTATYDDGTTADVTADATFEPAELTASGVYTVTASYGGMTDTIDVTVAVYDEDDAAVIGVEAVSQGATELTVTWDDAAEAILDEKGLYTDYVVYDLALTNPGETTTYAMSLVENMDTTNLAVYHVADDGTLTAVPYAIENDCVVFTTSLTGAFAYGSITVPEGYTLQSVTLANIPIDLFVGGSLDLTNAVITATYTKEGAEDFVRQLTVYDYDENNFSDYNVNVAGPYTAVFTFEGVTATLDIHVWGHEFKSGDVTVSVDNEGSEYGVANVNVAESTNENVATAIQYVIEGDNYVAYDISLTYSDGYEETDDTKTVTLPIPSGVNNPVVYYVSDDGATVTNMNAVKDGNGNVTFTTTHFSTYVIGESTEIEVPENDIATGSGTTTTTTEKEVYVLVSTPTAGNQYILVSRGTSGDGYALKENTTTGSSITVNAAGNGISAPYIETTDETIMWNTSSSMTFQSENGGYYLRYNDGLTFSTRNSTNWTVGTNSAYSYSGDRYRYVYNSNGTWTTSSSRNTSSNYNVYFYEKQTVEIETTTTVSGTYKIDGEDLSAAVSAGSTADLTSTLTFTPDSGTATTTDVSTAATYEIVTVDASGNTVDGDPNDIISKIENGKVTFAGNYGTALVKVSYTTDFGVVTDYITIEAKAPYYTIDLCKPVTDEEGKTTYESITAPVALKSVVAGDTYSVWAVIKEHNAENPDGEDLGDVEDDRIFWTVSDSSIAEIDPATGVLTFTGNNYGTITVAAHYLDENGEILCSDAITISVSATSATIPEDGTDDFPEYPNEGAVRHDKTATAVGNFSETGIAKIELSMTGVPYTTGSEIDVVVMLDMTGSMSEDGMEAAEEATKAFVKTIVVNEDGSYNGNRVAVYAFNSGSSSPYELVALTAISSDADLETANTAIDTASDKQTSGGTPYEEATKQCYDVLLAAKTDGIGNDRQQFCVFMSDGGPTTYYGSDEKTYYGGNNTSGDVTIASMMTNYTSSTASSWSMDLPTEYYTDAMKADDVTVYTVGLLLQNTPSNPAPWSNMDSVSSVYDSTTDSLTTIGTHYYFTSEILKQMASDESKYIDIFDVDNADKATAAFESIAQDILAAATDVTVADKMGSNYTMVFDAPNAVVDEADGGQEYYIEVTDYPLVPVYAADGETITDYTRGTGTSLLKLYFGYNASTGYYAATDAEGTKADTPTFDTVTLGDKGTKYYWTTVAADGDSGVSVVGADGTTYYFVSTGDGIHNMTGGAYASGTNTSVTLTYDDGTTATSATCQNMVIATPYFVYNAATKMLIWTLEEIAANELTLTYFLYLNNSGGFSGTEQEIEPQTYETNQFAYVDYTNFQGTECRVEFPTPQMTWNGAQVSYVFYLVNEAGQPVNRAGRVVPFSEAVYVTDVYTYAIVWNDLEQVAGLEAKRLAADLVPEVYELFDQGAEYNIHVYEDQEEVNLNNHFVIVSSVDSDETTANNGVYTTYVFNTKADGHKYTVPGTYVVDNGTAPTYQSNQNYWCKSYDVTGTFEKTEHTDELYGTYYTYTVTSATYTGDENRVPASSMQSTTGGTKLTDEGGTTEYVYYVDEDERIYTIVQKNDGNEVEAGFDFSNTTVAFAVVWKPELVEDVVVIDFGLDVVVDVITNDAMAAGVVGVRADKPDAEINSGTFTANEAKTADIYIDANNDSGNLKELKIGTASVENNVAVRFSLDKENGMQLNKPAVFYYEAAANYYEDGVLQTGTMYSSVTVIPATTVYYEDSFVSFSANWTVGTASSKTQDADRPGANKFNATYDADNVYGYDAAYGTYSTYSLGSAAMVHVDANSYGTATFSFYGTGFDVIGMTSGDTGVLAIKVVDANDNKIAAKVVNTYYGYAYGLHQVTYTYTCVKEADEAAGTEAVYSWLKTSSEAVDTAGTDGKPTAEPQLGDTYVVYETGWYPCATENALYQVPVMQASGLDYGKYTVTITATYVAALDQTTSDGYDLYLDAIRIYDPTGVVSGSDTNDTDGVVSDAYIKDGEAWPTYIELRDQIISAEDFDAMEEGTQTTGAIFIDQAAGEYTISEYTSYGPNNELYLANNQAIAFNVTDAVAAKDVQLGIKLAAGDSVTYTINGDSYTVSTATDMYYSILQYAQAGTVVIENVSGGILSLTNIKVTYAPADTETASLLWMDGETATFALMSLRRAPADTDDSVSGDTTDTETEDTVTDGNTNTGNTAGDNTNTEVEDTVSGETNAPEIDNSVTEGNGADDTTNEPAEDVPEEEIPEEDSSAEDETTGEAPAEQLGFWARLWNAIKNAFNRLFSWFGF